MSEWTKCSDGMPEDFDWYLAWRPGASRGFPLEYDMGEWWDYREERVDGITHWMPMPELPIEATDQSPKRSEGEGLETRVK